MTEIKMNDIGVAIRPKERANVFEVLSNVNVNEHIEKKNGLSYLSWAWAWAEVKKAFPDANYTIYETETEHGPVNYFTDGRTAWVKTGVVIEGLEHIEELPIMDYSNRSIPLEKVTSFDVNKAIQRSLTKACARHGLGLYIYAGEDLPDGESKEPTEADIRSLRSQMFGEKPKAEVTQQQISEALEGVQKFANEPGRENYRQRIFTKYNVTSADQLKEKDLLEAYNGIQTIRRMEQNNG